MNLRPEQRSNTALNGAARGGAIDSAKASGGFPGLMVLLIASLAAVFLAGGPREGGMGIFLAASGVVLLLARPSCRAPLTLWLLGSLLIAATGTSFLAQSSLGSAGVRSAILPVAGLMLPPSVTLDPRATLFWITLLFSSLLIAQWVLASPPTARRLENLALLAVLGCCLYGGLSWYAARTGWNYPLFEKDIWKEAFFGFFPNRNHTAGFLLSGAVLSLGLILRAAAGGRFLHGVAGAFAFAFLTALLLFNSSSRGGLLFLAAGCVIWVGGLGKHRSRLLLTVITLLAGVILILFLSSGSGLLERLRGLDPSGNLPAPISPAAEALRHDPRVGIWRDTLDIIRDYPLTGSGLGTYALVYPFYADRSLRDQSTALHPESDWLQLASEAGLPALILGLLMLAFLLGRIPALAASTGRDWPVRWAFLSAFLAEVLHGLIDVPLHKPELGWWVMLLGCIGFSGCDAAAGRFSLPIQRALFALGGAGLIFLGGFMIRAQWAGGASTPPFATAAAQQRIVKNFAGGDPVGAAKAIAEAREYLREYPMAHRLYYQLAVMLLSMEGRSGEARGLFESQQSVSPIDPDLAYLQGKAIARWEPMTAATFWAEALRRQLALDASPNSTVKRSEELYGQMIATAFGNWELLDRLPAIAVTPGLRRTWVMQQYSSLPSVVEAVNDPVFMATLSSRDQGRLVEIWSRRAAKEGHQGEVVDFLAAHPEYEHATAGTRAVLLASSGHPKEACELLVKQYGIPVMGSAAAASGTIRAAAGDVPSDPLEAARYYADLGNDVAARRYLDEAIRKGASPEALLERARLELRLQDWNAALADLNAWLGATGQR